MAPESTDVEHFTQQPWSTIFDAKAGYVKAVTADRNVSSFCSTNFISYLEHGHRQHPLSNLIFQSLLFKTYSDAGYVTDFDQTLAWNVILLREQCDQFAVLQMQKDTPTQQEMLACERNLITQQLEQFYALASEPTCPVRFMAITLMEAASALLELNTFETVDAAYRFITRVKRLYTADKCSEIMTPENTALFNYLCAQQLRMDGNDDAAQGLMATIDPQYLVNRRLRARLNVTLGSYMLRKLPANVAVVDKKDLTRIATYLDRAHSETVDSTGKPVLPLDDSEFIEAERTRLNAYLKFVFGISACVETDKAGASDERSEHSSAKLWCVDYFLHTLPQEHSKEQLRRLRRAQTYLTCMPASSSTAPASPPLAPSDATLAERLKIKLDRLLETYDTSTA
jgi:hypothetical protein